MITLNFHGFAASARFLCRRRRRRLLLLLRWIHPLLRRRPHLGVFGLVGPLHLLEQFLLRLDPLVDPSYPFHEGTPLDGHPTPRDPCAEYPSSVVRRAQSAGTAGLVVLERPKHLPYGRPCLGLYLKFLRSPLVHALSLPAACEIPALLLLQYPPGKAPTRRCYCILFLH